MNAIVEKYAVAAASGISNRDAILASGLAGKWGSKLIRLKYAHDHAEYQDCLWRFKSMSLNYAKHRKWTMAPSAIKALAKRVMDYWLVDTCPVCLGRGRKAIESTPMLSDAECEWCGGTGHRKLQGSAGNDLLGLLVMNEQEASAIMRKKIRDE